MKQTARLRLTIGSVLLLIATVAIHMALFLPLFRPPVEGCPFAKSGYIWNRSQASCVRCHANPAASPLPPPSSPCAASGQSASKDCKSCHATVAAR
jgi:hypothetical protein